MPLLVEYVKESVLARQASEEMAKTGGPIVRGWRHLKSMVRNFAAGYPRDVHPQYATKIEPTELIAFEVSP